MPAKFERNVFEEGCKVWVGEYRGLHSISHWHFENELIACKSGIATVMMDGHTYTVSGGMCMFCHSESIHYIESGADCELIIAQYDGTICGSTAKFWLAEPLFEDKYDAYRRMEDMFREGQNKNRFYGEYINASMARLVMDIFRGEGLASGVHNETRTMSRYKDLLTAVNRNYREINFTKAASFMNMSEAYFSRFFKKTAGMTFSRYLNNVRVSKAIEIMEAQPDITMAALMSECGFNTLRNFNRVFKEVTGYAPTQLPRNYVMKDDPSVNHGKSVDSGDVYK